MIENTGRIEFWRMTGKVKKAVCGLLRTRSDFLVAGFFSRHGSGFKTRRTSESGWRLVMSEAAHAVANEQECGAASFTHRHRLNHPDSSEQERVEYVVEQWRKISKLVGLPVPYSKIRSGFEGNERLMALFPDEEN